MNLKDYLNYLKSSARITIKISLIVIFVISSPKCIHSQVNQTDSASAKIDTTKFVMQKSAWGAVLRSAVLPGFGQFYNHSYWKIPAFWGALGYLGYQWDRNNKLYIKNRDLYTASHENGITPNETYKSIREFYRDQRDLFTIYIGIVYLLNLIDAYVDSHLFDFNVNENIHSKNYIIEIKLKL